MNARAVFAAACAQRLLLTYRLYQRRTGRGETAAIADVLDKLWDNLERSGPPSDLVSDQARIEALIPDEDETFVEESAYAQNAVAALAYAIRTRLSGDPQDAAWAARQVYEALDFRVTTRDQIDLNAPGAEAIVVADPLIQGELARQAHDLEVLGSGRGNHLQPVVQEIRKAAATAAPSVFDFPMP